MSEHGHPEVVELVPPSGLARFANSLEAGIRPVYTAIGYIGAAVLGLLVLAVVYSIIGRQFGAGLPGSQEISRQSLVIVVFTVMGLEHMGHEKMTVDVLFKYLPRGAKRVVAPFIYLIALAILAVAVWQLAVWGMKVQERGQTTMGTLSLPIYPFAYLATFGILTLIPIYFARFLRAVDGMVRK